jgi:uncharacterized protein (TIGR02118 family)
MAAKFIVVLARRPELTVGEFHRYFKTTHEPLALRLPGLTGYVQNFATDDDRRSPPAWDAIIELRFASLEAMEAAWASPAGVAATDDLRHFADLARSSWGSVQEDVIR